MVDFAKLREQRRMRLAQEAGSLSSQKVIKMREKTTLELCKELADRDNDTGEWFHNITEWEQDFLSNCIRWLERDSNNKLSVRQRAVLSRLVTDFGISLEVEVSVAPISIEEYNRRVRNTVDNLDDDIPF